VTCPKKKAEKIMRPGLTQRSTKIKGQIGGRVRRARLGKYELRTAMRDWENEHCKIAGTLVFHVRKEGEEQSKVSEKR